MRLLYVHWNKVDALRLQFPRAAFTRAEELAGLLTTLVDGRSPADA